MTLDSLPTGDAPKKDGSRSARRINAFARELGAIRYLEIGVHKGKTFLAVDVPEKTAVDPHFRFDASATQTDLVRCYEMTSDDWFLRHSAGKQFDLIFLDGLHTFEQTLRDFCNSLLLSHDRTVWVIDDTMPADIYSSCRDQKQAGQLRRKEWGDAVSEKKSGNWSGDVFKVVFAIHDFFPTLSYRTILAPGKPQTVVWRHPRSPFVPLLNSLEAISRLSYYDFRENLPLFQGGTEAEVLEAVVSSLGDSRGGAPP